MFSYKMIYANGLMLFLFSVEYNLDLCSWDAETSWRWYFKSYLLVIIGTTLQMNLIISIIWKCLTFYLSMNANETITSKSWCQTKLRNNWAPNLTDVNKDNVFLIFYCISNRCTILLHSLTIDFPIHLFYDNNYTINYISNYTINKI